MDRPNPPLDYSKKLLPVAIDEIASNEPTRIWVSLPIDDWDLSQGFEDISFARLAKAVDRVAHAIEAQFGRSLTFDTIAYIGVPDVRYQIVQVAAIKTGYRVLLPSPLNSTNIHISLMEQTDCVALLSAVGVPVDDILRCRSMKHAIIAELDDLLDADETVPAYPFHKTWEEGAFDPYLVLHSSGTTADPKLVEYKHLYYGNAWSFVHLPDVNGRPHLHEVLYPGDSKRLLHVSAPWHAMAATSALQASIFGRGVLCPGFRHRTIGTADICDFLEHAGVTVAVLIPWMMEDVARKPNAQQYIEKLDVVIFGGAVLSPFAATTWSKYTHIQNGYGATEAMATGVLRADSEDYAYVYFDTVNTGIEFRKSSAELFDEGCRVPLYEIVFTMNEKTAHYATWHVRQGITPENTTPPYPEYRIGDLWTPHPDPAKSSYVFRFVGRIDDTFTLSSASNIHPGPVETAIGSHPKARGVLVIGNQRRQPAALVELAEGVEPTEALADDLFGSVVQAANDKMPTHATIKRTHVALLPNGSFLRTPIGKIIRRKTEAKYSDLIDAMYRDFGDQWQGKQGRFNSITATTEIRIEVSEASHNADAADREKEQ